MYTTASTVRYMIHFNLLLDTICQVNSGWTVLDALQHYSFNDNGCDPLECVLRHANVVLQNTERLSRVNCFRVTGAAKQIRCPALS